MEELRATVGQARAKITRAKEHFDDALTVWREFMAGNPYEYAARESPEQGLKEMVVVVAPPPPPVLPLILGDAVHNLRSSLDLLMRQAVIANRQTPVDGPEGTRFPICKTVKAFEKGRDALRGMISAEALAHLDELKPYKVNNPDLWALNELDIIDKHRLLLTVPAASSGVSESKTWPGTLLGFRNRLPYDSPLEMKVGAVLYAMPLPAKGDQTPTIDIVPFITLCLAEQNIPGDSRIGRLLPRLIRTVTEITDCFAETPGFD